MKNQHFNTILADALAKQNKATNADRIRAMTDEELADQLMFLFLAYDFRGPMDILNWLREEVAE